MAFAACSMRGTSLSRLASDCRSLDEVTESWDEAEREKVYPVTAQPAYDEESIRKGRELFISENCYKCHGADAKGQTAWLSHEFLARQESLPEDQQGKNQLRRLGPSRPGRR